MRASFALPLVGQNRIAPAPPMVVGYRLFKEELPVLVLKQEGLLFSAFDLLDQETPALGVAENRHSGDLGQHNPDGFAAGLFCQLGDKFLREGVKQDRAAALAI